MTSGHFTAAAMLAAALALAPLAVRAADTPEPGSRQAGKPALTKADLRYFQRLAEDNLAEIAAGKLAAQKAVSDDVRKYAARMIEDHGTMFAEQRSMAQSKGIALPGAPDKEHANAMKRLQSQSGAAFDRSYMTQMVKDHEDTLKLVKDIASKATDAELKTAGDRAVPRIQEHLDMAKRLAANTELTDKVPPNAPRK